MTHAADMSSLIHTPAFRTTHSRRKIQDPKVGIQLTSANTEEDGSRPKTLVQGLPAGSTTSTGSPSSPERNDNGTRMSPRGPYSTAMSPPLPRRRRQDTNPRKPRTLPYQPARDRRSPPPRDDPQAIGGGGDPQLRRR